jgi:serine/threonine protein kinase
MAQQIGDQIFPSLDPELSPVEQDEHAFAAPELFAGQRDARSDVYALGAILYLLCTGSPPIAASQRLRDDRTVKVKVTRGGRQSSRPARHARRAQTELQPLSQDLALKPPHLLNEQISPLLEQILLRALALKPEERFASVRDLAEALESMHLRTDLPATPIALSPFPRAKVSRLRRLFEWLKR